MLLPVDNKYCQGERNYPSNQIITHNVKENVIVQPDDNINVTIQPGDNNRY